MKRRRWERHQPVIRARKVCRLGLVKTWRNSCRMARKLGVSCMSGLLAVRDPGVLSTTRIPQNGNEADLFHASLPVRKSAKPELSRPLDLYLVGPGPNAQCSFSPGLSVRLGHRVGHSWVAL